VDRLNLNDEREAPEGDREVEKKKRGRGARKPRPAVGERLAYKVAEAAALIGVDVKTLRREIHLGHVRTRKVGERGTLVLRADLERFLDELPPAVSA
jgi:excisionase family DNA binding protein